MSVSLTSSSTIPEIYDALLDAVDYDVTNDLTKAQCVVTAARMLQTQAAEISSDGNTVKLDLNMIRQMGLDAKRWITEHYPDSLPDAATSVVQLGFQDFRG